MMNPKNIPLIFAALAGAALLFTGCNTTAVDNTWTAPDVTKIKFNKIMVVACSPDGALRRSAEDAMKAEVRRVECVTSYSMLSAETDLKDTAKVLAVLKSSGIDGVVVLRPISDKKEITYTPGAAVYPIPYRTFRGYWDRGYALRGFYADEGYVTTDRIVQLETNIYEIAGERLIWSGATTSTNPGQVGQLVKDAAAAVRAELVKQKLISAD